MRLATAGNRRASQSLAARAAREDRDSLFVRQPPKIHPALPTGEAAPTRSSARGMRTHCVPQTSCGADS